MATVIGEFVAKIGSDMGGFNKGIDKADKQMGMFAKNFAKHRRAIGIGMTALGGAVVAGLGGAIKTAMDFNKEMANIGTLIPGSLDRINELKEGIRAMAVSVGKDTSDMAEGVYEIISAFGDTADTIPILEIAAKAATAGVSTTRESLGLLSAVTKGYGDVSKKAVKKASDLAFQTVTLGQTTFPELAASIGRVIPLTAELGVSQEELFAVMATATGVTGKAAEVSTQLRGVLQSLMSPTADMTKLFKDLGFNSGKAMLAEEGLAGSLEIIKKVAEEANIPLQKYISSIEGQTLALALTGTQADAYIEKLAAMRDSTGLTDIAFKEQTEGVNKAGFAFEQAKIQIGVMAQEIGDTLLPILTPLIKDFGEVIDKVADWIEANPKLTGTIVKAFGAMAGLLLFLGPILIILPGLTTAVGLFGAALAIATGPVGWIIAGIALLTTGSILLVNKLNKVEGSTRATRAATEEWQQTVRDANAAVEDAAVFNESYVDSLDDIADGASGVTDAVGDMIEKLLFSDTTAGRLGISMEDLYGIMVRQGWSKEGIARLLEEYGDDILNVNKLLEEMGLTAEEAQILISQQERETRRTREAFPQQVEGPDSAKWKREIEKVNSRYARGSISEERYEKSLAAATRGYQSSLERFHSGGIVPGSPGQNVPIMAEAGEVITPAGAGRNLVINVNVAGSVRSDRDLAQVIREEFYNVQNRNTSLDFQ